MAKTEKNFFQKLGNILGGDVNPMALEKGDIKGLIEPEEQVKKFTNQQEYEDELLRLQQEKYQGDQYKKISNDAYQKSVYYESTRIASYIDYEQMEYFPEIATALNIMSEESTCLFEDGKLLRIQSDSERIKNVLEHLFYNILQINVTLPFWTRNTLKYGDDFIFLKTQEGKGIVKAIHMKNIEINRVEGVNGNNVTGEGSDKVTFEWQGKSETFNEWQMVHFRMIGDDKKLPYGTSVLDKVRKVFKQLSLAEDAMMVYRISRAPERRVFKIDVGNIDANDVEAYVQKVSNKFKKSAQVNGNGTIDYRYNMLTQDEDYFIPVRNGMNSTVIDTLQGAQNLSDIGDIEFLQKKLFSGLQVPQTFLGFAEAAGDGKNLAMQDVRFARTINRIQQAMIMELNKIAIIHLYFLGFTDELNNFKLALANPSIQSDILSNELLASKLDNFIKATSAIDGGLAPMSYTEASKRILNKSDDEIILSIKQQYTERAEAVKLTPENIAVKNINTGIFDNIDKMYGNKDPNADPNADPNDDPNSNPNDPAMGSGAPDFGGGAPMGGDLPLPDMGDTPDAGGSPMGDPNLQERNILINERINKNLKLVEKLLK